jgi:selenocysteine lyase/cysteine desulfurase
MWVGSGHKWLGGPNGTGFTYVSHDLIPLLEPVWLGDQFYEKRDQEIYDISRFECRGTSDVCQWFGLSAAMELYASLNSDQVRRFQRSLVDLLRNKLTERLPAVEFRTPSPEDVPPEECTAILTFYFPSDKVKVKDLRAALWDDHKIWIQPDNLNSHPGHGARISCHYTVTEQDIDKLVNALTQYI